MSGSTSSIGAGGTFTYTGSTVRRLRDRDQPRRRRLRPGRGAKPLSCAVFARREPQSVVWDGKDNSGADFPVGTNYAVRASLHAGEYHFPHGRRRELDPRRADVHAPQPAGAASLRTAPARPPSSTTVAIAPSGPERRLSARRRRPTRRSAARHLRPAPYHSDPVDRLRHERLAACLRQRYGRQLEHTVRGLVR